MPFHFGCACLNGARMLVQKKESDNVLYFFLFSYFFSLLSSPTIFERLQLLSGTTSCLQNYSPLQNGGKMF